MNLGFRWENPLQKWEGGEGMLDIENGDEQPDYTVQEPPRVESEFYTQLQELRDRIRLWESQNGDVQ